MTGILLWGESIEEVWRPPNERIVILREPEGLARLTVSRVYEQIPRLWDKELGKGIALK